MSTAVMQDLPKGARFIGPDGRTRYEVTVAAGDSPQGFVETWNLSMTGDEAAALLATPGAVEPGVDPRDGFFAYSHPVTVEVIA